MRWRPASSWDIVLFIGAFMFGGFGLASILGMDDFLDFFDAPRLDLPPLGWTIYWLVLLLVGLHLAYNRDALLRIGPDSVRYRRGRIPGRTRRLALDKGPLRTEVVTREVPWVEAHPDGTPVIESWIELSVPGQDSIRIENICEEDALTIERLALRRR